MQLLVGSVDQFSQRGRFVLGIAVDRPALRAKLAAEAEYTPDAILGAGVLSNSMYERITFMAFELLLGGMDPIVHFIEWPTLIYVEVSDQEIPDTLGGFFVDHSSSANQRKYAR